MVAAGVKYPWLREFNLDFLALRREEQSVVRLRYAS